MDISTIEDQQAEELRRNHPWLFWFGVKLGANWALFKARCRALFLALLVAWMVLPIDNAYADMNLPPITIASATYTVDTNLQIMVGNYQSALVISDVTTISTNTFRLCILIYSPEGDEWVKTTCGSTIDTANPWLLWISNPVGNHGSARNDDINAILPYTWRLQIDIITDASDVISSFVIYPIGR